MENIQSWDFNAPQFVDFTGPVSTPDDDKADEYFDYDHENGIPVTFDNESMNDKSSSDAFCTPQSEVKRAPRSRVSKTPSHADTPNSSVPQRVLRSNTPSGTSDKTASKQEKIVQPEVLNTPENKVEKLQTPSPRKTRSGQIPTPNTVEKSYAEKQVKKAGGNICTDLNEWRKKTAGPKTTQNGKTSERNEKKEPEAKPAVKRQHRSLERSDSLSKRQRPAGAGTPGNSSKGTGVQRSSSFSTMNKKPEIKPRNHSRGLSGERPAAQRPRSGSRGSSTSSETEKQRGLTIPVTPTLVRRNPVKYQGQMKVKSSEQLEMEKIAFYRQELAKKRRLAQESCKTALSSKGPTLQVQHKELTKPEGFKFETDSRIKAHPMEARHDDDNKDFARILRSDTGKQTSSATKGGITKPEPFNFGGQRKRKMTDLDEKQAEKYESMAERLANFTKTPDRFRSRPRAGPSEEKRGRSRSPPGGVTVPKTPQFETRTRSRPVTAPSREDMEKKEIEEIQKHQFKAHPVNHKIFENSCSGIKKVPVRAPTVPEEFHLSSKNRGPEKDHEKEEHYEFHAQPLNKKILEGTVGVKEARRLQVTVPQSPAFALKHRARLPVVEDPKEEKPNLRCRAVPHFGMPFQPQIQHKKTEPEPFGFEERERKRAEEKRRKMEQGLEEEKRQHEFHANPLPDMEPHLPPKRNRPLTVQQPFNLGTDTRGAKKAEEWSKKMEEELHQQKEKARFKAKDAHVLEQEPFIPSKENKYTTDISEFEFNTAKRMVKRDAYETHKKAKQDELDNIRKQEQKMRETEERAEMERLRKEAVHKANPVKHYKGIAIRQSERPLTQPMSPRFKTDTRLRTRAMHGESFMST